jgi:hypothetical protein
MAHAGISAAALEHFPLDGCYLMALVSNEPNCGRSPRK